MRQAIGERLKLEAKIPEEMPLELISLIDKLEKAERRR
jgi:hypothetical protein